MNSTYAEKDRFALLKFLYSWAENLYNNPQEYLPEGQSFKDLYNLNCLQCSIDTNVKKEFKEIAMPITYFSTEYEKILPITDLLFEYNNPILFLDSRGFNALFHHLHAEMSYIRSCIALQDSLSDIPVPDSQKKSTDIQFHCNMIVNLITSYLLTIVLLFPFEMENPSYKKRTKAWKSIKKDQLHEMLYEVYQKGNNLIKLVQFFEFHRLINRDPKQFRGLDKLTDSDIISLDMLLYSIIETFDIDSIKAQNKFSYIWGFYHGKFIIPVEKVKRKIKL